MTRGDNILHQMINVGKGDVITVVGAGGKTSFINYFARHHKYNLRVLLTTTTKIYLPNEGTYSKMYMLEDKNKIEPNNEIGITVCGKRINDENKIIGLDFKDIDNIKEHFDFIIIEGDGSKRKKIKGWDENEPVVYEKSSHTIGLIDITSYNMKITKNNIHRIDKFYEITNAKSSNITLNHLKDIVLNKNGLFKNAKGNKILFINKVENDYYENLAIELINLINKEKHDLKLCYGSIMKNYFKYK